MEPSCITTPLQEYLVYPNERIVNDSMLCLLFMLSVEDEWSKADCDRAPSHDGGSIWFMLAIRIQTLTDLHHSSHNLWDSEKLPHGNYLV
jgi:hypothetical protein